MIRHSILGDKPKTSSDITEIFSSIQGEGIFVGVKQVFVRFKDCNLKCSFCDEARKAVGSVEYSTNRLIGSIKDIDAASGPHHSVSFTGGEPLLYTGCLKKILCFLKDAGLKSYLETNGTLPERLKDIIGLVDIVAMDFKLPSSTGEKEYWNEHREFLKIAASKNVFVKAVVTSNTVREDIEKAVSLIKDVDKDIPLVLQPVTPTDTFNDKIDMNLLSCFLEIGLKSGLRDVRVIPQVHKMLGVK